MNAIYILLIVSLAAGITTSIIAFFIHKMKWHQRRNKSPFESMNLFVSNLYQFNDKLLSPLSVSMSIAFCMITINILYIFFLYSGELGLECALYMYLISSIFRTAVLFTFYALFYDKRIVSF